MRCGGQEQGWHLLLQSGGSAPQTPGRRDGTIRPPGPRVLSLYRATASINFFTAGT
jgi:hypothetical protein